MKDKANELRKIAESLRAVVETNKEEHTKVATVKVQQEPLDPRHVVNFLKVFGA